MGSVSVGRLARECRSHFSTRCLRSSGKANEGNQGQGGRIRAPGFLGSIVQPVLSALPSLLPRCKFAGAASSCTVCNRCCHVGTNVILIKNFSVSRSFGLCFAPLFRNGTYNGDRGVSDVKRLIRVVHRRFREERIGVGK